jgi:predicted aspartyl protease
MSVYGRGFTINAPHRLNVINTDALVGEAFSLQECKNEKDQPTRYKFIAIWDTGATGTVISPNVVEKCNLKPIGKCNSHTASDTVIANVYLISIELPNKVIIPNLRVSEGNLPGEADILIGMDIISIGDLALTNGNGKTTFSFEIPAKRNLDFNKFTSPPTPSLSTKPVVGRNAPCPCGSGKKYKHCCGKV